MTWSDQLIRAPRSGPVAWGRQDSGRCRKAKQWTRLLWIQAVTASSKARLKEEDGGEDPGRRREANRTVDGFSGAGSKTREFERERGRCQRAAGRLGAGLEYMRRAKGAGLAYEARVSNAGRASPDGPGGKHR